MQEKARLMRSSTWCVIGIASVLTLYTVHSSASETTDAGFNADRIVIEKAAHRLSLMKLGKLVRSYNVALGRQPKGPKEREGDERTPEGLYIIDGRNAASEYHRALHISYPNATDRANAVARGFAPGGNIMIHGIRNGLGWIAFMHRSFDWTKGCIAVTDGEIDEIWNAVPNGAVVEIRP